MTEKVANFFSVVTLSDKAGSKYNTFTWTKYIKLKIFWLFLCKNKCVFF